MKRTFTKMMAALALLLFIAPLGMMGQNLAENGEGMTRGYESLFSIASGDVVSGTSYKAHTAKVNGRDFVITFGGNNSSVGTNSNNRPNCNLSSYTKYAVSPVTTSSTASAFACTTSLSSIGKISYTFNGGSNQTNTKVYLIYSANNSSFSQIELASGTQGATISSGTEYTFSPKSGYFALLFVATNTSGNWRIDNVSINFYQTKYSVTYNANGGTGSVPPTNSYLNGATVTVAAQGDLSNTGFNFVGWNTKSDGTGTTYVGGNTFAINSDVTLFAKWEPATSDPYVTAADVNLAYDAESGSITYEIHNAPTPAGTLTASTESSWLTVGNVGATVPFTCSANTGAARSATVLLTYTYGNNVTATKEVTITQAIARFTVTYKANGGTGSNVIKNYTFGDEVTILNYNNEELNFTVPSGKSFKNWNTSSDGTGSPFAAGTTINIAANYELYAQWENIPTYRLVTNVNQLVPGKQYLIASSGEDGSAYAMGYDKGNNRNGAPVTISDGKIEENANVWDFVISGYTDHWTIFDAYQNGGYLYAASSNSNYLKTQGDVDVAAEDDNAKWSISIGSDGVATIVAQGTYTRNYMRYNPNSGSPLFACYASNSTTGSLPYLYVKDDDVDLEIYSPTTIAAGKTVECETFTIGNTYGSLTIAEGGQLIHNNDGLTATMQKNITAYTQAEGKDNYYLMALPFDTYDVAGSPFVTVNGNAYAGNQNYDFYTFDGAATQEEWQAVGTTDAFDPGVGFLYANNVGGTLNLTGTLVPSNTPWETYLDYDATKTFGAWNLIGNPFACNATISASDFYVIDGEELAATSGSVAPLQGVMVQATAANQSVTFAKATGAKSAQAIKVNVYKENASKGAAVVDRAIVRFDESQGLEKFQLNPNHTKVYFTQDNKDYAVVHSGSEAEMPVSFKAEKSGSYTFNVETEGVEMNYLHLIDNKTGADVDLLATPSYTFEANANDDYESRFRLVFKANADVEENAATETFAYFNGSEWVISNTGDATLQVIDMMGRVLRSEQINGNTAVNLNQAAGIYMLRLVNGENVKVQKVVVR